jgi:hypothetical protein
MCHVLQPGFGSTKQAKLPQVEIDPVDGADQQGERPKNQDRRRQNAAAHPAESIAAE